MDSYALDASQHAQVGLPIFPLVIMGAVAVLLIAAMWRVFSKAGKPGWASLIPIYNLLTLLKIAGKPGWWFVLFLIPGVNAIIGILVALGVAEKFGKGTGFGLGLAFLGPIFYPVLAFGSSEYQGPLAA